jgi:hypothetical protein
MKTSLISRYKCALCLTRRELTKGDRYAQPSTGTLGPSKSNNASVSSVSLTDWRFFDSRAALRRFDFGDSVHNYIQLCFSKSAARPRKSVDSGQYGIGTWQLYPGGKWRMLIESFPDSFVLWYCRCICIAYFKWKLMHAKYTSSSCDSPSRLPRTRVECSFSS